MLFSVMLFKGMTSPAQDATITPDVPLTEYNLDGRTLTLVLYTDTFVDSNLATASFTLNNPPANLSIDAVSYDTDTSAFIILSYTYADFDVSITSFSVSIAGTELRGGSQITTESITITAFPEPVATLSSNEALVENTLNDAVLILDLEDEEFVTGSLAVSNFILENAPPGLSIETNGITRVNNTRATIALEFAGDFDVDYTDFRVTVKAAVLIGSANLLTNALTITHVLEKSASVSPNSVNETELNGKQVVITLDGDTWHNSSFNTGNFILHNHPSGLSISGATWLSSTTARITFSYTGDFDSNINNLYIQIKAVELSGSDDINTDYIGLVAVIEPKATISNGGSICSGDTRNLVVDFEYTSSVSYTFRYTRNGSFVAEITTSDDPYILPVSPSSTSTYTYEISYLMADGLVGETYGQAVVTVNPLPNPSISGSNSICAQVEGTYTTSLVSGHAYSWEMTGGEIQGENDQSTVDVLWTIPGAATVRVTETITSTGCSKTTPDYAVNVKSIPDPPVITGPDEFCSGSSIVLSASGTGISSYRWSTGTWGSTLTVTSPGAYSVQGRSSTTNCWSLFSPDHNVTENPRPQAYLTLNKTSMCEGESALLTVTFAQGTAPFSITYKENTTSRTFSDINELTYEISVNPLVSTTYELTQVTDQNCTGSKIGTNPVLTVNAKPTIDFNPAKTTYVTTDPSVQFSASPSGGFFSGSSAGIAADGTFFPDRADIGVNYITYQFTDPSTQCSNSKTVEITVIVAEGEIIATNAYDNGVDKYIYCIGALPDTIIGSAANAEPGQPTSFSGTGITNIGNNKAVFNPASAGAGDHSIIFTYLAETTLIPLEIKATFRVDDVGIRSFSGLPDNYCVNNDSLELVMTGNIINEGFPGFEGAESFTGPGVSGPFTGAYWFSPQKAGTGVKTIAYNYTRDFSQCKLIRTKNVTVNPLPQLSFEVSSLCILIGPDSVQFINTSPSAPDIISWEWNFGDPASGPKNTSTQEEPWHDYNSIGSKIIKLRGQDNKGCINEHSASRDFGEKSLARYSWERECFGDSLQLFAQTDGGRIKSFRWDFGDGLSFPDTILASPKYRFAAPGNYDVKLKVLNDYGCTDSISQNVPIRPTVLLTLDEPYSQDFETGDGGWVAGATTPGLNSWVLGPTIPGMIINDPSAGNVWITNPAGYYQTGEKSYVEGPCFDFSVVEKPMISMKVWTRTENTRDGAVMQSSINDGTTWQVVGSNLDGINWYNTALLTGEPGGQRLGWTGNIQDTWREARNALDYLKGERVRLRIAFGADAVASEFEGFAFDDVWIGERTRTVLLEHFANNNVSASNQAETDIYEITEENPTEVIAIQYHTAFPQADEKNLFYPAGPGSRTLYYGVSSVPYSVMDGTLLFSGFDQTGKYLWGNEDLFRQVLVDPLVDVDISGSYIQNNQLFIKTLVGPKMSNMPSQNLTLQLAVVENEPSGGKNVLRKMIPDPGGISLLNYWGPDDTARVNLSWNFSQSDYPNPDSLSLVAFVQNENDKSVCQVSYMGFSDMGTGTGVSTPGFLHGSFDVFPNPASGMAWLRFYHPFNQEVMIEIYSDMGVMIQNQRLRAGPETWKLDLSHIPPGLYLIRVRYENGTFEVKKLVRSK